MEEKKLDAQESIELITRMIRNTRQRLERHSGRPFLIWGYTTVAVSLLNYSLNIAGADPAWSLSWFLIPVLGILLMRLFPEKKGSFYGMVSYSYDWMGDADGVASQNGISADMNEDLGGGWVTYGIGAQFMMGDSAYFYGELERTSGGDIDNPYLFNVGLRWNF